MGRAHARRTDPATSHQAAASVDVNKMEAEALVVWRKLKKPLTSYEAYAFSQQKSLTAMPDSGFRTRTKSLCDKGLVRVVDRDGRTGSNRAANRYVAV